MAHSCLAKKGYICSVDVLKTLDYLNEKDYEDWRFGRVDYLERVCNINLKKLSRINKQIRRLASSLGLQSRLTAYNKYGKGPKRALRFSKSGKKSIEDAYATHYVSKK